MKNFKSNLVDFIKSSTCCYTTILEIKKVLEAKGFIELEESKTWKELPNKFYVIRNDASIIAIELPKQKSNKFLIVSTHCDTPSLLLKPKGEYLKENYLKYNIMPYGGLLNCGWLDHPLSLAGRVLIKNKDSIKTKIIDFKKPMLIVPSVAIHQNAQANSNLDLNMQTDLQPILTISNDIKDWSKIMDARVNEEVIDYDLFAYNIDEPRFIGLDEELLVSPRIDNLTSVYSSLEGFLNSSSSNIKVLCSFNNEETGSLSVEGADSNFLLDILKRVTAILNIDLASSLASSFIISADNTHAIHPNHAEYADDTGYLKLNEGFAIAKDPNSSTNALSSSIIKMLCKNNNIKYQDATAKNDISGGSTLSTISLRHVSILSVDVGIGQLSMHSSLETCSINDIYELYKMLKAFYSSDISIKKEKVLIK